MSDTAEPTATGTYRERDGQPIVSFQRTFPHPIASVWAAITDPAQLATWFPTSVAFEELRVGAAMRFEFAEDAYPAMTGTVRELEPPRRLAFSWGDDVLTFELAERDGGAACSLALSVELDSADKAARDGAGWDQCLDGLAATLGGTPPGRPYSGSAWQSYYDHYERAGFPATAELLGH